MKYTIMGCIIIAFVITSCSEEKKSGEDFKFMTEQFADLQILRYQVPGFEQLDIKKKKLIYYLYEAALSGREIIYDQNYKHNLTIKRTLEAIIRTYRGNRETKQFRNFMVYAKRIWFSNGIHHHYSGDKFVPDIPRDYFTALVNKSKIKELPLMDGESVEAFIGRIVPIVFNPARDAKRVNQDPEADLVAHSANNYYENVTQAEAERYYAARIEKNNPQPVSYGLNSKLVKKNGELREKIWKVGGMYTAAIEKIVFWLGKALEVTENERQHAALEKLVEYYKSGDLASFDAYNIAWVQDTDSDIDVINGFIETYGDAMGYRGAYESIVSFVDREATKRIAAIGREAQWFEDNTPLMPQHKKEEVKGISATVITVAVEAGDASPSTPIGINLPNANWIRAGHGSKSVSLGNIIDSYSEAAKSSGMLEEFGYSEELNELERKYGTLTDNLHTDMHEVIGHASGKLNPGVSTPNETLKNYASTLEEARADLVALYYLQDPKLVEIGVMPVLEAGRAQYIAYIRNGLMWQLRRIKLGDDIEQAHMRNRQLVASWVYEKGKAENVIEKIVRDGKTYFVIRDYEKLRGLFGKLLRETQRIKSEGDYNAAQELVETYGVKVDRALHEEVLQRYSKLSIRPYSGFINPRLVPQMENGKITDIKIEYPQDFTEQMLEYAAKYAFLPAYN